MEDHEDCKTINHVKINLEDETKVNVLKIYHIKESNTFRDSNTTKKFIQKCQIRDFYIPMAYSTYRFFLN